MIIRYEGTLGKAKWRASLTEGFGQDAMFVRIMHGLLMSALPRTAAMNWMLCIHASKIPRALESIEQIGKQ